ncbi:MAG: rod-binding protein [Syntrophomonadaceae bacterium]|jgi:flagellar protein FlgJ
MNISTDLVTAKRFSSPYENHSEKSIVQKDFSNSLKTAMNGNNHNQLYSSCQELESVLVNKLIESMRKSIPRGEITGNSFATDTFESMLYTEYARSISKTGSLGLADIIYKQLSTYI